MLSIILPSYKEPHLNKTIEGLLEFQTNIEIIAVLDGYWVENPIIDTRVRYIHVGDKRGMRNAINLGVSLSKGDIIMKADAHCMFGENLSSIPVGENQVVIPRRYFLDTEKWEVMDLPPVDAEKIVIEKSHNKFHGVPHDFGDVFTRKRTMIFQGSCWIMRRSWWDKVIGELDEENYGPFSQEPIEIAMKTYENGGTVICDTSYWYAHSHRSFKRTHNVTREESDAGNAYALTTWMPLYKKLLLDFNLCENTKQNSIEAGQIYSSQDIGEM